MAAKSQNEQFFNQKYPLLFTFVALLLNAKQWWEFVVKTIYSKSMMCKIFLFETFSLLWIFGMPPLLSKEIIIAIKCSIKGLM